MRFVLALLPALALTSAPLPAADPPSPGEIVAAAPAAEWVAIAAEDLLVMTLAPDAKGRARRVVIQLMPPPFAQGWVGNIRVLAKAHWWDGTAVTRVQDNYVAQWGDPNGEDAAKAKPLPAGLKTMAESAYEVALGSDFHQPISGVRNRKDPYADATTFIASFPASVADPPDGPTMKTVVKAWPVHCYGMVGVGRNLSPDTGSGAELYTVIGHAPRHLDRNIALVGRVVEGIEHLSSLPRGTGALGVYETAAERTPIVSIRLASELPVGERPRFEYLSTEGPAFARYAEARANRRDAFFIKPAGGADVCNVPVPVRRREK